MKELDQIQDKLITLIAECTEKSADNITPNTRIQDTGIDSLGMAELIFQIEDFYKIIIEDSDDVQKRFDLGTVNDVANTIAGLMSEKAEA